MRKTGKAPSHRLSRAFISPISPQSPPYNKSRRLRIRESSPSTSCFLRFLLHFFFKMNYYYTERYNNNKTLKQVKKNWRCCHLIPVQCDYIFFSAMLFYLGLGLAPRALPVDFTTFYSVRICYPWSPKMIFLYLEQRMSVCLEHIYANDTD